MQMLQGAEQLCGVESTPVLVEFAFPLQMIEQLATVNCAAIYQMYS